MQDFKFHSYLEFFDYLTEEHKVMVSMLKELIQDTIPDIKEKLSWNVPFFYKQQTICYIWPGSIPWGKKTYPSVQLGFTKGYLMEANELLESGSRRKICTVTFNSVDEIEKKQGVIVSLLEAANNLDK